LIRLFSIFLAKLFIKDYQAINKSAVRSQYGILQGWLSIVINLILGIVKLIIALLIGSLSLLADAIHSLSDMVTSFILIISFYWGQKPSDHEHPFGHGRIEQIGALIMAVLIGVTGIELVKAGVERVINPMTVEPSIAAFIILILTVIIKEILSKISNYYGQKIQSIALEADAWHHRTDSISSILVIIAMIATQYGILSADGIGGIVIGIFIIYISVDISRRTGMQLLGTRPSPELFANVESLVKEFKSVRAIHDMVCHEYGPQKVITFHLEIPDYFKLSEAHTIVEKIENKIFEQMQIQATVHLDPVLPVIKNRNKIEKVLRSIISANDDLLNFHELRLIGEEDFATLVLDIETKKIIPDDKIDDINENLKRLIREEVSEIRDVRAIFILKSTGDSDEHLA
jgi:cation diffusion facilitator family transporter